MIVADIETSGIYPEKHGIWQIGALDFYNPENTFLQEARIDDEDEVAEDALKVIGKTESYLRNKNKQSQKQLLENFFKYCDSIKIKNCLCQNPQFDLGFLTQRARKYSLKPSFHYRAFDLHSLAQLRYSQLNEEFLIKKENEKAYSDMGLTSLLKFCGLEDRRMKMKDGKVEKEGTPHNALEDAKLTAECFSRIINSKSLLDEFSQYKVPEYLSK